MYTTVGIRETTAKTFHYASSRREREDEKAKKEAHADFVYEPINTYGKDVDIVLEAKAKEGAVERYLEQWGVSL